MNYFRAYYYFLWTTLKRFIISLEYFNAQYFLNVVNYFIAYYYFFWTTLKRIISRTRSNMIILYSELPNNEIAGFLRSSCLNNSRALWVV